MSYEMADNLAVLLVYMVSFLALLGVGGIISDYILPRFPKAEKFIFRMFDIDEDGYDEDDLPQQNGRQNFSK